MLPGVPPPDDAIAVFTSLRDAFSNDTSTIAVPLILSSVPETLYIPVRELWSVYVPLLLWLRYSAAAKEKEEGVAVRYFCGVAGPAGSGKTSLAALLTTLGGALRLRLQGNFPTMALLSMDAYHLPGVELVARGLTSVKGAIETIHGTALAGDLALLTGKTWLPPTATATATAIDNDNNNTNEVPLASRSSWAIRDPTAVDSDSDSQLQSFLLPEYDRLKTHDPLIGAVRIGADARIILVEGLFIARGDGATSASSNQGGDDSDLDDLGDAGAPTPPSPFLPLGPDATAWPRVLSSLHAVVVLRVPLALCRARCLARRMRSQLAREEPVVTATDHLSAEVCARLDKNVAHYAHADAPTWAAVRVDARTRSTLVLRVPLPAELQISVVAAGGDALKVSWQECLSALKAVQVRGAAAYDGVTVRRGGVLNK